MHPDHVKLLTPPGISALAVVRLEGPRARPFVATRARPVGDRAVHARWGDVDDPLIVPAGENAVELHLHGGPRIVERVIADAVAVGFVRVGWDEGLDEVERWLPHATTDAGIAWTLAQRDLDPADADPADRTLERLLVPARVAVVGPANAGKSTLVNRLSGREASLVADSPGTTRDWVETPAFLLDGALPVVLLDTPGRRDEAGEIERAAIGLSDAAIGSADAVVLLLDATRPGDVPGGFDDAIVAWNKADAAAAGGQSVSAATGAGVGDLEAAVAARLRVDLAGGPRANRWPRRADSVQRGLSVQTR